MTTPLADPDYLRRSQYADASNLDARARLHRLYGRGEWNPWVAGRLPLFEGARVLEIGCGPGWLWEAVGQVRDERSLRLTLTDLSPGMVDIAVDRASAAAESRDWQIRGVAADASSPPFPDASFDVVIACHMLYHLPDPSKGLSEIVRVLAPGGAAAIATNGAGHMADLEALESAVWPSADTASISRRFTIEGAALELPSVFAEVTRHAYEDDLAVTDPADLLAYLQSSPPASEGSEVELRRLKARVDNAFAAQGGRFRVGKSTSLFVCR